MASLPSSAVPEGPSISAGSTAGPPPLNPHPDPVPATPSQRRRPLQREGARHFLSAAEQAMQDAILRSSSPPPETVLGKRAHQADDAADENSNGNDTEPDEPSSTTQQLSLPSISNVTASTLRYTSKKKLRPEQRDEVDAFLLDSALGRQAKLFVCLLSLENKVDAFQSAAPPYQLSEELKTNINNYGLAVILSVNISAYKGDIPRTHVLDILKRYRFDLPAGIEHDYASWEKISTHVGYSLTQTRARVKKLIRDSIKPNTNIFSLAQVIVHSTPCRPTVQLCARVALMRAIYVECNGCEKYWNLIDARLEFIRSVAGKSTTKTARAFNKILNNDRALYGADEDYAIKDTIADEWQQRVDSVVAGTDAEDVAENVAAAAATG